MSEQAEKIVRQHTRWALAGGFVPVPGLDLLAVGGAQLRMLAKLAEHYGVAFAENRAKSIISALAGPVVSKDIAMGTFGSLLKGIPFVGIPLGFLTLPIISAAITQALGKVFVQHFESGQTFLDFSPEKAQEYFKQTYDESLEVFRDLKKKREETKAAKAKKTKAKPAEATS